MSIFCNKFIVVKAQRFWGLLGAGVPPLLGALTPFAYWGALKVFLKSRYTKVTAHTLETSQEAILMERSDKPPFSKGGLEGL